MRRIASGLLALMAGLYILARSCEGQSDAWPWVRAFAEAAVVGGLADWFAVTALFRHPLGLPIPHTAIVRKEKRRIGSAVASFMRKSFLTPDEVRRQWHHFRPLQKASAHLSQPDHARQSLHWILHRIPQLLSPSDRQKFSQLLASGIRHGASALPIARIITILLQGFLKSPSKRSLLAPLLARLGQSVATNRDWVMHEASKTTKPTKLKILDFLNQTAAAAVSGKAVEKFSSQLTAASQDHSHPLYEKIEEALRETAAELQAGKTTPWESLKESIIHDPQTLHTLQELAEKSLQLLADHSQELAANGQLEHWTRALSSSAQQLAQDPPRLLALEKKAGELLATFTEQSGPHLEALINRTVDSWEADELIERIEDQVGPDLQFIRVNGTLIGGLVGLLLHGLGLLIWG